MSDPSTWHRLQTQSPELPRLLLKAHLDDSAYTVQLTDLSRIWTQTLQKHDIVAQARRYKCSIDPSEDDAQYGILLDKIRAALNQDAKTSLSLILTKDDKIKLDLTAPLPRPLPELDWTITLERAPDNQIETNLVTPLLQQADRLKTQMQRLIAELQAKDKVISKITDRLEQSGHDLSVIFPNVSSMKLSKKTSQAAQRDQFARLVRGLGRFDEEAWEKQINQVAACIEVSDEVVNSIFANLPAPATERSSDGKDWWRGLTTGQSIELSGTPKSSTNGHVTQIDEQGSTDEEIGDAKEVDEDGEFQRQGTPPHLRQSTPSANLATRTEAPSHPPPQRQVPHRPQAALTAEDGDETDDEDDLDGPSRRSQRPQSTTQAPAQSTQSNAAPPTQPAKPTKSPRKPVFEEETDDETEDDDLDTPSQPSLRPIKTQEPSSPNRRSSQSCGSSSPPLRQPSPASKAPTKKLGTLGGRPRKASPTPPRDPSPVTSASKPVGSTPKSKKGKLGTLGGRRKPSSSPPAAVAHPSSAAPAAKPKIGTIGGGKPNRDKSPAPPSPALSATSNATSTRQARATERTIEPSAPRETSEERADAKRLALKRELEEKAKAPVKKKRKF